MRAARFVLIAVCLLLTVFALGTEAASNWDKDDHEIFELQSALESAFGKSTTFYSLLDLRPSASSSEIKRAYRKKSLEWHPDKNSGVKGAQQRFERLGLVHKILRDERKDRYDRFLKTGFPKWRKDGYFYERYRPALGSVMVGMILVTMAVEMGVSRLTSGQERKKIQRLKMSARLVAWGPRYQAILASLVYPSTPGMGPSKLPNTEKKVRVSITGFPALPPFPSPEAVKHGVDWDVQESLTRNVLSSPSSTSDGAPIVDCLVHNDQVLLLDKYSNEWVELNEADARPCGLGETWPIRLVAALVNKVTGKQEDVLSELDDELDVVDEKVEIVATKSGKKGRAKKNK